MKTSIFLSTILFSLFILSNSCTNRSGSTQQQTTAIETQFTVAGNCGMCKTRIENAAKEAGAISANWERESQSLKVSFNNQKTSLESIQKQIAAAGHDNDGHHAEDHVYDALHSCCKYERIQH
ncbi:heavy-metal-associated domain-containing protein [Alkalitalea saponilacus]|uniref:Copper chaperone CopZ n=1 Tax=Alkalitalea saponilacus TaxID=889453 RepID=A0A1T5CMB9_9BACT|nr:hypothetical protein [Alkalitalea saponilacus]ASB49917.1 hypothetical protein CDL62_12600 [Alkalitalea saponilacus]SKB60599.1 Copper chaperone CopZ [Alkalitalea saponilacus]